MKKFLYSTIALLLVVSIFLGGCTSGGVCTYIKNCYFENQDAATFSDVNLMVDDSLIPVNACIFKIGKVMGNDILNKKAICDLIKIQKQQMNPSNFTTNNLPILYGDLVMSGPNRTSYNNLPADLQIYLDALYKSFVLAYKEDKLPEENDPSMLHRYEEMLCLMGKSTIFKRDLMLLDKFKEDQYFTSDKILSDGIYIISGVNFLILRGRMADSNFYPLPFTTSLIEKRKKQVDNLKEILWSSNSHISNYDKLFILETIQNFGRAFNFPSLFGNKDKNLIQNYLNSSVSDKGLFVSNGSLTDSIFATCKAMQIAKVLGLEYPGIRKIKNTLRQFNKSSDGVYVVYDQVNFNPWDTYWSLFIAAHKCQASKLYNSKKIESIIVRYLQHPDKHSFEELYYASKTLYILDSHAINNNAVKEYLSSFSNFSDKSIQDLYFFLLLNKFLDISISPEKKNTISLAIRKSIPYVTNDLTLSIKAYLSLKMLNINAASLRQSIENKITSYKVSDIRTLFYEYLFAKSISRTTLQNSCIKELNNFKTNNQMLFCMNKNSDMPSLMATYYAYRMLYRK